MLWTAGQQRTVREGRERLTELYVGARDGYIAGNVAIGKAKARGDIRPAYARNDRPTLRSPAARDRALAKLGLMFPGMVRRTDS